MSNIVGTNEDVVKEVIEENDAVINSSSDLNDGHITNASNIEKNRTEIQTENVHSEGSSGSDLVDGINATEAAAVAVTTDGNITDKMSMDVPTSTTNPSSTTLETTSTTPTAVVVTADESTMVIGSSNSDELMVLCDNNNNNITTDTSSTTAAVETGTSTKTISTTTNTTTATTIGSTGNRQQQQDKPELIVSTNETNMSITTEQQKQVKKEESATLPSVSAAAIVQRPPTNWYLLQPIIPPNSASYSTNSLDAPLIHVHQQPCISDNDDPTTQLPIPIPSDRMTRCPPLHRYTMPVPYQPNNSSTVKNVSSWYLDIIDEETLQNTLHPKKRPSAAGVVGGSTHLPTPTITTGGGALEKVPNSIAIQRCTPLYLQQIEHTIEQRQFLYHMTWFAIMEEIQFTWYHITNTTTTTSGTTTRNGAQHHSTSNTNGADTIRQQPFSYYTDAPTTSTTSVSTNVSNTIANSSHQLMYHDLLLSSISFTPSNLMQRIKQGCILAYQELQQNDSQYQQQMHSAAAVTAATRTTINDTTTRNDSSNAFLPRRSSTRIVINQTSVPTASSTNEASKPDVATSIGTTTLSQTASSPSLLLQTKHGGRVAGSLLQHFMSIKSGSDNTTNGRRRNTALSKTTKEIPNIDSDDNNESVDDDDEYNITESDVIDDDDDEDDIVDDDNYTTNNKHIDEALLGIKNPYLVPDRYAILEWIGKKSSRIWSTNDIQTIFAEKMIYYDPKKANKQRGRKKAQSTSSSKRRNIDMVGMNAHDIFTMDLDPYIVCHLLYDQSSENTNSTFHSLPFMMSTILSKHEKIVELSKLLFPKDESRGKKQAKLLIQLSGGDIEDINETIDEWDLPYFTRTQFTLRILIPESIQQEILSHVEQQAFQQQEAYREQRQFETYRYKSIQSGYSKWGVSWLQAASELVRTNISLNETATTEQIYDVNIPPEDQDLALAKSLAAQIDDDVNNIDGGRRKTRRVGESSGVFYGNQSNLSQKQLMDALLRLISSSKQPFQTLVGFLNSLPDDSGDPMKRMRTIVGKLLYKRNQLTCIKVETDTTDSEIWRLLQIESPTKTQNHLSVPSIKESLKNEVTGIAESERESITKELEHYLCTIQQTELQLRRLVMKHLTEVPIAIIATAGDDRTGSMESMDDVDFEDPSVPVPWQTSGHELISQKIYRPIGKDQEISESTKCYWFRITAFVPSIEITPLNITEPVDRPFIGRAKEPTAVERRIRFRAEPVDSSQNFAPQILTESQVQAGIKAAQLQVTKQSASHLSDHPLPSSTNPKICLIPINTLDETISVIEGFVVGHDQCMNNGAIENRILILPKMGCSISSAFWTSLIMSSSSYDSSGITCKLNDKIYSMQQYDFHQSSKAFHLCMSIVNFLERHPKCGPFLLPVDPMALGIPEYFNVIKNPMDVSTLRRKLENGDYALISPNFLKGQDSTARMLNGTFRRDVERIFDNAMLFNPPHDWIHQAASFMKKAVLKKIEQMSASSSTSSEVSRQRKPNSMYVDYDSDVDMYTYESDYDDDNYGTKKRKHRTTNSITKRSNEGKVNRSPLSEDAATRAIERGIRIQRVLSDTVGLRGPFTNLPIQSNAFNFSLSTDWTCYHKQTIPEKKVGELLASEITSAMQAELDELRNWHRLTEENEQLGVRRSARVVVEQPEDVSTADSTSGLALEFVCPYTSTRIGNASKDLEMLPKNRFEVEILRERLHELHFAKLFQSYGKMLSQKQSSSQAVDEDGLSGSFLTEYTDGSFPPYLGRVVPMVPLSKAENVPNVCWEIREPFVVPALRWIIRGLLHTEHLVQSVDSGLSGNPLRESLLSQNENVLLFPNHVYYIDEKSVPFDVLDTKELTRRKKQRTTKANEDNDSDDDIEMSEYEKARAERMARNKDRLVALGLA